ncbi:hypothetical protein ACRRTK_001823 [Alexandromys fortis]
MTTEVAFAPQLLAVSEMLAHPPGVNCHRGASLSSDLQRGGQDWVSGIVEERGFGEKTLFAIGVLRERIVSSRRLIICPLGSYFESETVALSPSLSTSLLVERLSEDRLARVSKDQLHPHISGIIHILGDNSDNNSSYERKLRSDEPINTALLLISKPTFWRSVRETDLQSHEMTRTAIFNLAPLRQKEGFQGRHPQHSESARSPTASLRMLHLKVQFLDDSQKIFVVDCKAAPRVAIMCLPEWEQHKMQYYKQLCGEGKGLSIWPSTRQCLLTNNIHSDDGGAGAGGDLPILDPQNQGFAERKTDELEQLTSSPTYGKKAKGRNLEGQACHFRAAALAVTGAGDDGTDNGQQLVGEIGLRKQSFSS